MGFIRPQDMTNANYIYWKVTGEDLMRGTLGESDVSADDAIRDAIENAKFEDGSGFRSGYENHDFAVYGRDSTNYIRPACRVLAIVRIGRHGEEPTVITL